MKQGKNEKRLKNSTGKRQRIELYHEEPYATGSGMLWQRDEGIEQYTDLPEPTTIRHLI